MDHNKTPYFSALKDYADRDIDPLDVPGHKRGRIKNELTEALGDSVYIYDANAPKGLDNLSRPQGVIKEAQILMADAFKADKAYFLLNGTTQGIITMILTVVRAHEKIILPRNTHKSIISALILSGAVPVFLPTVIDEELGISNGFTIKSLLKAIDENPDAKAVFVINTTYFGACTDLKSVVTVAHDNNMLVLVDEAHGGHLSFNDKLPIGAMEAGADMSAVSIHKTLGSLTQTSVLLAKGPRVDYNRIRVVINILQSTSPSSIFLASLDVARKQIYFNGKKELDNVLELSQYAKEEINKIDGVKLLDKAYFQAKGTFDYDETKLLISIADLGKPGYWFYNVLKDRFDIQIELGETYVILAILAIGTVKRDIDRLVEALKILSSELYDGNKKVPYPKFRYNFPVMQVRPRVAFHAPKKFVHIDDAIGEICGESIMIYPPGIPLVIPGEIIDSNVVDMFNFYLENGFSILTEQEDETVKIVDQENWNKEYDEDDL